MRVEKPSTVNRQPSTNKVLHHLSGFCFPAHKAQKLPVAISTEYIAEPIHKPATVKILLL